MCAVRRLSLLALHRLHRPALWIIQAAIELFAKSVALFRCAQHHRRAAFEAEWGDLIGFADLDRMLACLSKGFIGHFSRIST